MKLLQTALIFSIFCYNHIRANINLNLDQYVTKTDDGFIFNWDKLDVKINAEGSQTTKSSWTSKTVYYNFDTEIEVPKIQVIEPPIEASRHVIDFDGQVLAGLKPEGSYKVKGQHSLDQKVADENNNNNWDSKVWEWSHQSKFSPLSYSTKNLFATDLRLVSNYSDNGLLAHFFGDEFITDPKTSSKFNYGFVFDLLLDTSKAGGGSGCNQNSDFFYKLPKNQRGQGNFGPDYKFEVKDNCVFQSDFVLNEKTLLQIQIINYRQYIQLKYRFPGPNNDGEIHTFRILDNDSLPGPIHDSQKNSYEIFYRSGARRFQLFMTIPKKERINSAFEILKRTFGWTKTLEWASFLNVETYNKVLQEENFDLQPAIDEFNFIIWEPFRENFFQYLLGNMYEDVDQYLSFEYLTQVLKIVLKNIVNELEEPSEDVKQFLRIMTENSDVAIEVIDGIFEIE